MKHNPQNNKISPNINKLYIVGSSEYIRKILSLITYTINCITIRAKKSTGHIIIANLNVQELNISDIQNVSLVSLSNLKK